MSKVVYKITYPNGKIYVGLDLTGTATYFGSPSRVADIANDLTPEQRQDFAVRKQILWESDTAPDSEARAMEMRLIVEHGANDPDRGYNVLPRHKPADRAARDQRLDP